MGKTYQRLYPVYFGNRTGYIDQHGDLVISPKPFYGHDFCEGFAVIEVLDHGEFNYGFLDESGRTAIRARFLWAEAFTSRFARVEIKHGAYSFVDEHGKLFPHTFTALRDFSEDLAAASTNGEWGYIDATGKFVIEQRFTHAGAFSEGLAAVTVDSRAGYIDTAGNGVIKDNYQQAWPFRAGRAAVQIADHFGYIDRNDKWIVKPVYDFAWPHHEGLAHVQDAGYHGFINLSGDLVVPLNYDDADHFSEGLAAVRVGKKWGYLDALDRMVIRPQFLGAQPFHQGIARVVVDEFVDTTPVPGMHVEHEERVEVYRYIDKIGRVIWPWPSFFNGEPYPKDIGYKTPAGGTSYTSPRRRTLSAASK
jgi:hypothetical protein